MVSYLETYPNEKHPIIFKHLNDLVIDKRYSIGSYPSLERPRQKTLDEDHVQSFRSIARDYCILKSPGHTSWTTKQAQKDATFEIFHTDTVQIPVADPKSRFQTKRKDWSQTSYFNRWYLQGMTRVEVEKIFKSHFGLTIPLSSESTSDHWMPAAVKYTVEVKENVWEDRVVLFFDGFVATSLRAMKIRLKKYGHLLRAKKLGDSYLEMWRMRWAKGAEATPFIQVAKNETGSLVKPRRNPSEHINSGVDNSPKYRGRKRRTVLRQLRNRSSVPNQLAGMESLMSKTQSQEITMPVNRGRLRRRERRRNNGEPVPTTSNTQPKILAASRSKTSDYPVVSRSKSLDDSICWKSGTGEKSPDGPEKPNNKVSVKAIFTFHVVEDIHAGEQVQRSLISSSETALIPRTESVPTITIRAMEQTNTDFQAQRYRVFSYANPSLDPLGIPSLQPTIEEVPSLLSREDEKSFKGEEYQIHVADLVDEVGVIDSEAWRASVFFSYIETAHPNLTHVLNPLATTTSREVGFGKYWQRFTVLLNGFMHSRGRRELPHSLGYGIDHNNPVLKERDNRWGFLDVDGVTRESKRPRWRANYRFELFTGSDPCNCALSYVKHDLIACKSIYKDYGIFDDHAWKRQVFFDEILPSVRSYSHRPYESLRELENTLHKYYPPPVRHSPESTAGSSSDHARESPQAACDESHEEREKRLAKAAERTYEMGVVSLMGLGVPKNIRKGIHLLVRSAELGCLRGKATACSIALAYGIGVPVPQQQMQSWLHIAALGDSRIALQELRSRIPDGYKDCKAAHGDTFSLQHSEVLSYSDDIAPQFDLSNTSLLLEQIQRFNAAQRKEYGDSTIRLSDVNVMAEVGESNRIEPTKYFIFGSLLHIAAAFGYIDAVSTLLEIGYDIDAQNTQPTIRTPLLCALKYGHADIAKLLISRGATCQPLIMWVMDDIYCSSPTALHYLVNIEDDTAIRELAVSLVKAGSDPNFKCDTVQLANQTPGEVPVLTGKSVTPLRWAVIHQRSSLVKILLTLGAKFAYEEYIRPSLKDTAEVTTLQKGCLLLETPSTDLDILELFFARARVPGPSLEFSQTPLGLLVSEDDGPERRLRPGFGNFDCVRDALNLLLDLQPGYEEVLLWSAVRHDHIDIVKYLLEDLNWSIESKFKGLTSLHTAILYGRTDMVRYLSTRGANVKATTERRGLTCYHLLMLLPRHPQVDQEICDCISNSGIEVDAKEKIDSLTAFHLAVRNKKLPMVKKLLDMGADPDIPVADQLNLLSQGRGGYLERSPDRPQVFSEHLTILGEVILQHHQDNFYHISYISDLLVLLLDRKQHPLSAEVLTLDKALQLSLLHLLAILPHHDGHPHIHRADIPYSQQWLPPPKLPPILPHASLLRLVLIRSQPSTINMQDDQGDTPLHYACAAQQVQHIRTLLASGADPSIRNAIGLNPLELMAWAVIFLSGQTLRFTNPDGSWHPEKAFGYRTTTKRSEQPANALSIIFTIFAELGHRINPQLQKLVLAWYHAKGENPESDYHEGAERNHLELVPEDSAKGIIDEEDPDKDADGRREVDWHRTDWRNRTRRPYMLARVQGPLRFWKMVGSAESDRDDNINFERAAL